MEEGAEQFYTIKEDGVYLKSFLNKKERILSEDSSAESIEKLITDFIKIKNEAEELISKINETTNKGSFLIHLEHLKVKMDESASIGAFEDLYIRLSNNEHEIRTMIAQNREKNLAKNVL